MHIRPIRSLLGAAMLAAALFVVSGPSVLAQAPAPSAATLTQSTIKALQEALNRQGIAVAADGVLNDQTRAAIRTFQSQHHLPVTGEPDRATLDKLGVRESTAQAEPPAPGQAVPGQMPQGGMMNCGMMQGQMQAMMQMMQGMMGMMQTMQGQMGGQQPGQMQPGQMQPGQMQPGQMQPGQMPMGPMQRGMPGAPQTR